MPRVGGVQPDGVQAVVLTLRILEHLVQAQRDVGVTPLAAALGTTKSRIFRHLQTLVAQGYVARSPDSERYRVGSHLVALGLAVAGGLDLASVAGPVMRHLRETLGHSVVVSQLEPEGMRVISMVSGTSPFEIGVRPGSLLAFHATAQGKIGLAFGPETLRQAVFRSRLDLQTPRTIGSATTLRREIEQVQARGWAVAPNESLLGVNVLAAPIFGAGGDCVGAIGIVDSIQYVEEAPSDEQVRQTRLAAQALSTALGSPPRTTDPPPVDTLRSTPIID
ncbi:MAG: IclR family transcriptional regulator [Enterovirga sp.]|nr:IclR family transcriptional regulator [Enterovirga sp.]